MKRSELVRLSGMPPQRVSDLRGKLEDPEKYRALLLGTAFQIACLEAKGNVRGTQNTGEYEWYTPPEYLNLARDVLGEIDLDPASSVQAQETVRAKCFFTKEDDGLTLPWHGRIWLNPPYSQPDITKFANKMVEEVKAGRVTAAITLTHNYTDTEWFQTLAANTQAICFPNRRIKFIHASGDTGSPTQGQAFFYFGQDRQKFITVFSKIGFIMVPIR